MIEGEFYKASNLQEACDLLAEHREKARVLAGGTDLMVQINDNRLLAPAVLVYIGQSGLNYIKEDGDKLVIGATSTHSEIIRSELARKRVPLLVSAIETIGSPAIRNVGTLGGNLANASPAADSAVALLALGASFKLVSKGGERVVASDAYFTGPGETVLKPDEVLAEVIVPFQKEGAKWAYRKIGKRRAEVCAVVSAAVALDMANGTCESARIALGSVAPTPLLATEAAGLLAGQAPDSALVEKVAKAAAKATSPIDDVRGTAWYRRRASQALAKTLLGQVLGIA